MITYRKYYKKIYSYFLFILFIGCSIVSHAQNNLVQQQAFTIHSKILGEDRIIDVQLPKSYFVEEQHKANYPVVYILDGERNFPMMAAVESYGTRSMYRSYPEMIVVGIRNVDRNRDYTPTKPAITSNTKASSYETSGQAASFLDFINKELKPYVNSNFRSNGFDVLHGHSFGGLFAMYTWLYQPDSFDAYLAIDPSFWWDDAVIYKGLKNAIENKDLVTKSVFIALAYESETATKDRLDHGGTIRRFCEEVMPLDNKMLENFAWKYYPDKDHGTVPWPSSMDGLVSIFNGIQLDVKKVPQNPELIFETYSQISKKLKHTFLPDESLLIDLIRYTQRMNQEENAKILFEYSKKLYPKSQYLQKFNS